MVNESQSWELTGWRRSSSPVPMATFTVNSEDNIFHTEEEPEVVIDFQNLPSGVRVNENGYLTNAPKELAIEDYIHRIVFVGSSKSTGKFVSDPRFKEICPESLNGHYSNSEVIPFMKAQLKSGQALKHYDRTEEKYVYADGCEGGNHYWVDETVGPFTSGCGKDDADNYDEGVDWNDDSLCTYTCNDPNRLINDDGSCADCKDKYGLNDDGVCEQGIADRFLGGINDLPWEKMGVGLVLLIGAKIALGRGGN